MLGCQALELVQDLAMYLSDRHPSRPTSHHKNHPNCRQSAIESVCMVLLRQQSSDFTHILEAGVHLAPTPPYQSLVALFTLNLTEFSR